MEDTGMTSQTETQTIEHGCVKWFNNRAGYGFITVTNGDHKDEDIFIHHTQIDVHEEQYKYLVQGEYVDFALSETDGSDEHKWHAVSVKGPNGGSLMCETRQRSRGLLDDSSTDGQQRHNASRGGKGRGKGRGKGGRDDTRQDNGRQGGRGPSRHIQDEDGVEYILVKKKTKGQQTQRE